MEFGLNDIETLECDEEATREDDIHRLQRAINGGMWSLQGSYGRSMMAAIEVGECALGKTGCRDYFGNYIPSRTEVKAGTKGSVEFVEAHGKARRQTKLENQTAGNLSVTHTQTGEWKMDIRVNAVRNIVQFVPLTDAGRRFLDENCEHDGWAHVGASRCTAERYAATIVTEAQAAGLSVH